MFSGKGPIPACSSGNSWGQRDVLHSLLQGSVDGRRLLRAICRAQLVSALLRFLCWPLPTPVVAPVCSGINAREWFSSTVRDRQTFTLLLSASGIVLQLFTDPLLLRGQRI